MRDGLSWPHRRLPGSPLHFFSLCICRSTCVEAANWTGQQMYVDVYWLATACGALSSSELICSSVAAASNSTYLHSRVFWDVGHLNFTSTPIQHPASTPVDAGLSSALLWNSRQIETVLYREVMKNETSKTKTPVFIFEKVLRAEKLVAHQNRPVTDSCSVFECLGLQNARMRLTGI